MTTDRPGTLSEPDPEQRRTITTRGDHIATRDHARLLLYKGRLWVHDPTDYNQDLRLLNEGEGGTFTPL